MIKQFLVMLLLFTTNEGGFIRNGAGN